jgi:hypothetical protein
LSFTFDPGSFSIDDTIDNDYSNPGPHLPFCGDEDSPCEPLASMGRGWNVSYTVALSIVGISVSVTWGERREFPPVVHLFVRAHVRYGHCMV